MRVVHVSTLGAAVRTWRAPRPVPVEAILSSMRRGSGDPTYAQHAGRIWRAMRTPTGTVTLALPANAPDGQVRALAWGPGADWALERVPRMLGDGDDPEGFAPRHPRLATAWRRHEYVRVPATGLVFEALLIAILEQKVTGQEAWYAWRRLVREHGDPAPGPGADLRLAAAPSAPVVRQVPSWTWRQLCVDHARFRAIVVAAQRADALERTADASPADADTALRSLPGVGVWTAAEVRQRAHGDRDAVSFGDYHLSTRLGRMLTGEPVDDARMAELLEEYRPHRYRVQRMVELAGPTVARTHPRMPPRRHLPTPRSRARRR